MATTIKSAAAANAIELNETMETLIPTIKETLFKGKDSEKVAYTHIAQSLIHYRDCGASLAKLRDEFVKDGYKKQKFYDYVDETFGIKERMNQRYMQLGESKRLKGVTADFFSKMNKPTLTNVITALSFNDTDWKKVIKGDDTPFKPKKQTQDEKESQLKKEFESKSFENIDFEQYKAYADDTKVNLIAVIDSLTSQTKKMLYTIDNKLVHEKANAEKVGV